MHRQLMDRLLVELYQKINGEIVDNFPIPYWSANRFLMQSVVADTTSLASVGIEAGDVK